MRKIRPITICSKRLPKRFLFSKIKYKLSPENVVITRCSVTAVWRNTKEGKDSVMMIRMTQNFWEKADEKLKKGQSICEILSSSTDYSNTGNAYRLETVSKLTISISISQGVLAVTKGTMWIHWNLLYLWKSILLLPQKLQWRWNAIGWRSIGHTLFPEISEFMRNIFCVPWKHPRTMICVDDQLWYKIRWLRTQRKMIAEKRLISQMICEPHMTPVQRLKWEVVINFGNISRA